MEHFQLVAIPYKFREKWEMDLNSGICCDLNHNNYAAQYTRGHIDTMALFCAPLGTNLVVSGL
jgi:hypothetical protein